MSDATELKLDELAAKAGVSPRTVRYYVQRGLLPAPTFRGKDTAYGPEHLVRLKAIARLQGEFLPLDAIQEAMEGKSLQEIADLHRVRDTPREPERVEPVMKAVARWERISLAPGLELHLADDASSEVRELARRVQELAGRSGRGGQ